MGWATKFIPFTACLAARTPAPLSPEVAAVLRDMRPFLVATAASGVDAGIVADARALLARLDALLAGCPGVEEE